MRSYLLRGLDEDGNPFMVDRDQWIRPDVSMEEMAAMKTPFKENGLVTAATSSPLSSGACALLLMSREKAGRIGAKITISSMSGVHWLDVIPRSWASDRSMPFPSFYRAPV